jgi:hypothetical protein
VPAARRWRVVVLPGFGGALALLGRATAGRSATLRVRAGGVAVAAVPGQEIAHRLLGHPVAAAPSTVPTVLHPTSSGPTSSERARGPSMIRQPALDGE